MTKSTGIRTFDHRSVAGMPEVHAAQEAIDKLAHALNRGESGYTQQDFVALVQDLTIGLGYSDQHKGCDRPCFPIKTDVADGWVKGTYVCPVHKETWQCGYSVDAPEMI